MNEVKQIFYKYITTPIAKCIDFVNIPKQIKIRSFRKRLALVNKNDYIEATARILIDKELQEKLNEGLIPNPAGMPYIIARNVEKALAMYNEKKKNGYFDELNILIK